MLWGQCERCNALGAQINHGAHASVSDNLNRFPAAFMRQHKIADLERSTNNNIEHQSIEFVTDTIVPWVTRLEQEVNVKLFGARAVGSVYTKMAVNALMRGDAKSRAEFYRTMTQIGDATERITVRRRRSRRRRSGACASGVGRDPRRRCRGRSGRSPCAGR